MKSVVGRLFGRRQQGKEKDGEHGEGSVFDSVPDNVVDAVMERLCFRDLMTASLCCTRFRASAIRDPRFFRLELLPPDPPRDKSDPFQPLFSTSMDGSLAVVRHVQTGRRVALKQLGTVSLGAPFPESLAVQLASLSRIPPNSHLLGGFTVVGRRMKRQRGSAASLLDVWLAGDWMPSAKALKGPLGARTVSVVVSQVLRGLVALDDSGLSLDLRLKASHLYAVSPGSICVMTTRGIVHAFAVDDIDSGSSNRSSAAVLWLAPEMRNGALPAGYLPARLTTSKWDVYALGVTVAELLLGSEELRAVLRTESGSRPAEIVAMVKSQAGTAAADFVGECLCTDPLRRPSATELAASSPSFLRTGPQSPEEQQELLSALL